jgi:hypothetical protein
MFIGFVANTALPSEGHFAKVVILICKYIFLGQCTGFATVASQLS